MNDTNDSLTMKNAADSLIYGLGLLALFNIVCAVGGTVYRWITRQN